MNRDRYTLIALLMPAAIVFVAFFLLPLANLFVIGGTGALGWAAYGAVLTEPRYLSSLVSTVALAGATTIATLIVSGISGVFLTRNRFRGREVLTALLTLPLAFPGVVIGFMVIMLAGRQGLIPDVTDALFGERLVFAYSMAGLFIGYLYFSIPRTILTLMAAAEKLDPALEEAARSLGAGPLQRGARRHACPRCSRRCWRRARSASPPRWAPSAPRSRSQPRSTCCRW